MIESIKTSLNSRAKTSRLLELDALRGLAALFVVLFHYTYKYDEIFKSNLMGFFEFKYGHYGVQLFFIISGFVIFLSIFSIKTGSEFIYKRFVRLYPIFWICMILTFLITTFSHIRIFHRTIEEFILNFSMVPILFQVRAIDGVYWSLLPEILFYVYIFFLYKLNFLEHIEKTNYIWLVIASTVMFFVPDNGAVVVLTNARFAYLFIAGINFYKIWEGKEKLSNHFQIAIALLFCFYFKQLEEFIFSTLFIFLFYLFVYRKIIFLGRIQILTFLGAISYCLYLVHQFIGYILIENLQSFGITNYFLLLIIPVLVSLLLSSYLTYKIERPILNKLRKSYSSVSSFTQMFKKIV